MNSKRAKKRASVVVADDDKSIRFLIEKVLSEHFDVLLAEDGLDALDIIRSEKVDMIVSDIVMPRLGGIELTKFLKADPKLREIPIILLTAKSSIHALAESLDHGADDYLSKPIRVDELRARVRAAWRTRKMYLSLQDNHDRLKDMHRQLLETQGQLVQAQKLEAIGRLAAGIAHEINTPLQYVGDNAAFLKEGFEAFSEILKFNEEGIKESGNQELISNSLAKKEDLDLEFFLEEIPTSLEQSLEGIQSLSQTVRAMKEFSHPGCADKSVASVNRAILNTVEVAKHEWKFVAKIDLQLDPNLPHVPMYSNELRQVLLNLLINASHSIADCVDTTAGEMGDIRIRTRLIDELIEIRIEDSGTGIPSDIVDKVFDPFFTTKEVGKGTGQGLAIARSVVVEKHSGELKLGQSEIGGACFIITLPVKNVELIKSPDLESTA